LAPVVSTIVGFQRSIFRPMVRATFVLVVLATALSGVHGAHAKMGAAARMQTATTMKTQMQNRMNPIRRVVNMLQMMQKKVEQEGKTETDLFDKFMCYCKNGLDSLRKDVADGEEKLPQLRSEYDESSSLRTQTKEKHKQRKQDLQDAKEALSKGKALREKEAASFTKESTEDGSNILAMGQAVGALEKGMGGAFLQTGNANMLRRLVVAREMSDSDRDVLSAFLSQSEGYAPASGEIVGILKQMKDTMEQELKEAIAQEESARYSFEQLAAAKSKEIAAATTAVEELTQRLGELAVKLEELKESIGDTEVSLEENKRFLNDVEQNCGSKKKEWELRQKLRTDELIALADTIKLLNDDDSLDLFKKTLPTPGVFLQEQVSESEVRKEAIKILRATRGAHGHMPLQLDLIALAIRGKKVGFEKVVHMIDEMIALLGKEQTDDEDKKTYCLKEIDETEDKTKAVMLALSDLGKAIDNSEGLIETLTAEIAALMEGIKTLDAQVAEATSQRQAEHTEHVAVLQDNNAAKELIGIAKNRMYKFYAPKMYKEAAPRQLTEEQRISQNMGVELEPTPMPGGIANTGIVGSFFLQLKSRAREEDLDLDMDDAPPGAAPETFGDYKKKTQESSGVIGMMDMLLADIEKQIQEGEFNEAEAQKDYENFVKDSAEKRTQDSSSITDKTGDKARLEEELLELHKEKTSKTKEALALSEYTKNLHGQCDWLLANFGSRKQARAGEVESLQKAKSVLSGADYSLLQKGRRSRRIMR